MPTTTTVALIGNPNSGKTTLFNALTGANQFTGNWPGVTVEKKEGRLRGDKSVRILDLPGIYSLTPFSPEEIVARDALTGEAPPGAVLNIVDGTNLERNLYLTLQLLELGLPVIVAVNCADVLRKRGDVFRADTLAMLLGCPVVEISALKGFGLGELIGLLKDTCKYKPPATPATSLPPYRGASDGKRTSAIVKIPPVGGMSRSDRGVQQRKDSEAAIAARYDRIEAIAKLCLRKSGKKEFSQRVDDLLLNRWLALPIFVLLMFLVYYVSVAGLGSRLAESAAQGIDAFGRALEALLLRWDVLPWLRALAIDGLLAGAGTVLGFVPQMALLFACLAFLEGCGYLARIAFILDCLLRRFGLSGKCFMPMLLATGCGVPAILSTRAIDSTRERKITAVTCTFLPCSAKLPVIALMAGAFFGGAWWLSPLCYLIGAAAILLSSILLQLIKKTPKALAVPQVLELPPYRLPSLKNLARNVWDRTFSFVKKAGSVILLSAMGVWFLSSVAWEGGRFVPARSLSQGLLAELGRALEWLFRPLGFGQWQAVVATLTAFVAKENAVSTLGILYSGHIERGFTPLSAFSFLIFNLLSMPCVAAVSALRREMGSAGRTLLAVGYQCAFAYAAAFLVYQAGQFL